MKTFIKKMREKTEKILGTKFTRSLVIDITNDLYNENLELKNDIQLLKKELDKIKSIQNTSSPISKNEIDYYKNEFLLANDIWRRNGASKPLRDRLEYLSQSSIAWKNCPHEIWLIYISILLELGEIEISLVTWKRYLQQYPEKVEWLHRYIAISNFAVSQGITKENVVKASTIYETLTNSRSEKKFENLLVNAKSIAIVGNGPSEKGLHKGKNIDEHEIVIRFNNFKTYGFEDDYGKKTDVWGKCSNDDIKHDKDIYNYAMIVYEADYLHHPMEYNYHDILFHDMQQGKTIDYLDFDLHMELRELLGSFPSTGLLIVWLVAKLGLLYKTDIYGFSFLQKHIDKYASHYFNDRDKNAAIRKSGHHDFDVESKFVNKLFEGRFESQYPINDNMNLQIYNLFLQQKRKKELCNKIRTIHSITHRPFAPNGGSGGGGAVLSCQKILVGSTYLDIECKYTFFESNKYTQLKGLCDLHDLWGAALFAIEHVKDEHDTLYITHDYGTAFGLYLMGKKYVYINHLQGPRLEEKTNFGEKYTERSAQIIQECEKLVCENARYVCFPSMGAAKYFENSSYQTVDLSLYHRGPVLYNTLYAFPESQKVDDMELDNNIITILSVGQLTYAKGIDQCVYILEELAKITNKKIRWIIIGKGPLKNEILEECESLKERYQTFDYRYFERCEYTQMQYLQDISDVYLMLQRISIFDLTTLEVMKKGKIVALSNVGGNPEFNKENNIILHDNDCSQTAKKILEGYKKQIGKANIDIFNRYFSNDCFVKNYQNLFDNLIKD